MDPQTLDNTGATAVAETHPHILALTRADISPHVQDTHHTTHVHTDHRHFTRRRHETHTAKGMKTPAVYIHDGTLSPTADIAEDATGVARELPLVHLPVLLPAETPRAPVGPGELLQLEQPPFPASRFNSSCDTSNPPPVSLTFLNTRSDAACVQLVHA